MVKQYLWEYMNNQQNNWVLLLLSTQLTYNISINTITDVMSFFINYRYNVNSFLELKEATVLTEQVNIIVQEMQKMHK